MSVLMHCRNGGKALDESVASVLQQPECLELLIADDGSSDGSRQRLEELAASNPRLRLVNPCDSDPADSLNQAFRAARGTLIGLLRADDLYLPGAMARAVAALNAHPEWLMVMGEREEFNAASGLKQRNPSLPPSIEIDSFGSHCGLCQPAVFFRRSMGVLLGPFDPQWQTAFAADAWLRAFAAFPHTSRIYKAARGFMRPQQPAGSAAAWSWKPQL